MVIIRAIAEWRAKRPKWRTDEELWSQFYKWLRQGNYKLEDLPVPNTSIAIRATETWTNRVVTIAKMSADPWVRIFAVVPLQEPIKSIVMSMSEDERADLLENIALELAKYTVGYDASKFTEQGFTIIQEIIPDAATMTKEQLLEKCNLASRGMLVVQILLSQYTRAAQRRHGDVDRVPPVRGAHAYNASCSPRKHWADRRSGGQCGHATSRPSPVPVPTVSRPDG